MNPQAKSFSAKPAEAKAARTWWVIDAEGKPLGRLASLVANVLRGKNKPTFTPHVDTGDFVIVVNAAKVKLTGRKLDTKEYHSYSGYPGGLRSATAKDVRVDDPDRMIREAVKGMLPKNRLSRRLITKLKVYGGEEHPHTAQKPQPFPKVY